QHANEQNDTKLMENVIHVLSRYFLPLQPGTTDIVFRYLIVCSQLVILMMFTIGFVCCFYITVDHDLASIKFILVIHCIILLLSFCNIVDAMHTDMEVVFELHDPHKLHACVEKDTSLSDSCGVGPFGLVVMAPE
ncbi:hypothetical protein ACJX0J_036116, partial [Zea mays]